MLKAKLVSSGISSEIFILKYIDSTWYTMRFNAIYSIANGDISQWFCQWTSADDSKIVVQVWYLETWQWYHLIVGYKYKTSCQPSNNVDEHNAVCVCMH